MRKSEAEHLLEHLKDHYEGPLRLIVGDIRQVAGRQLRLPNDEHPYFVFGIYEGEEETGSPSQKDQVQIRQQLSSEREILAWEDVEGTWKMRRLQSWQITRSFGRPLQKNIKIYDTRKREFVPLDLFQVPSQSE